MTMIVKAALGVALGLLLYRWLQHFSRRFLRRKSDDVVVINKAELAQLLRDFEAMGAVLYTSDRKLCKGHRAKVVLFVRE